MTRDAVICAACGAKVREDRPRCLRCGQPLLAASVQADRSAKARTKLLAAGAGLAVVALSGIVLTRPDAREAPAPVVPVAAAPKAAPPAPPPAAPAGPVTAMDARQAGTAAYAGGDIAGALAQYEQAVEKNPEDVEALNSLGQMLVRAGRAGEAIVVFDRAIALAPDRWAPHFNRARAFAVLERWQPAVAGYQDALRLFPDDYATQFNLAKALQRSGDLPAALAGFERAIQLAPGQPDFHLSHGLALEAAQRPKDAAAAYRRYLELADDAPDAEQVKARIALLDGAAPASS